MKHLENIETVGNIKSNDYLTTEPIIHPLTAASTTLTIDLSKSMKHVVLLNSAPSSTEITFTGGNDKSLTRSVTIVQALSGSPKTANFNVNDLINFESFSGAIGTHRTYNVEYYNGKYQNIAASISPVNYRHLSYSGTTDVYTYINANQTILKGSSDMIYVEYHDTNKATKRLYVIDGSSGIKYGKNDGSGDPRADVSASNMKQVSDFGATDAGVLNTRSITDNNAHSISRGTAANIASANPLVRGGEIVGETDTGKLKYNKGNTNVNYASLPFINVDHDIIRDTKALSTPTATTTVSMLGASYATLNITQNTAITFSDLKAGVRYLIHITQSGTNTVTFSNLDTAGNATLTLSGNYDVIEIVKNPNNANAVLLNSILNIS